MNIPECFILATSSMNHKSDTYTHISFIRHIFVKIKYIFILKIDIIRGTDINKVEKGMFIK